MKKSSFLLSMSLLIVGPTFAQDDLVPATTDDIGNFDSQLQPKHEDGSLSQGGDRPSKEDRQARREERKEERQARREERKEERQARREERREERKEGQEGRREDRKENFGDIVKEKAQELKDMPKSERPQMGGFVSDQRRQNGPHGGGRHENGSEGGANADSRVSAPSINNEGKPADGQGGGSNRPPRHDRPHGGHRPPQRQ